MHNSVARKRVPQVRVSDLIAEVMRDKKFENSKDWKAVRDEVLKTSVHITENNVDVFTMDYFLNSSDYSLGKSYFDFLKENNLKPNLATVGKYLRLFYSAKKDSSISSNEEDYILHMYVIRLLCEPKNSEVVSDLMICKKNTRFLTLTLQKI